MRWPPVSEIGERAAPAGRTDRRSRVPWLAGSRRRPSRGSSASRSKPCTTGPGGRAATSSAATLAALRASIASRGIIEPLLLRRRGTDRFEVVCGSRRLRAARDLGQTHVPAIVRELSEREALLVAAWTTVERRQHTGDRTALSERLLAAGFTAEETRVLADQPTLAAAQSAAPGERARIRASPRSALASAPFRAPTSRSTSRTRRCSRRCRPRR